MSKYKLLISDIDGTIIPQGGTFETVADSAIESVKKALESGAMISLATGRNWSADVPEVAMRLGLKHPVIAEGGSIIADPKTGKVLWKKPLSVDQVKWVYDILTKHDLKEGYILSAESTMQTGNFGLPASQTKPTEKNIIHFLEARSVPAQKVVHEINSTNNDVSAHLCPSWKGQGYCSIDIVHREATKRHAVEALMDMLGVSPEDTVVLGDSNNDAPMYEVAGLGVAVGNATKEIKQLADYIAPRQEDDALAHVIKKFML